MIKNMDKNKIEKYLKVISLASGLTFALFYLSGFIYLSSYFGDFYINIDFSNLQTFIIAIYGFILSLIASDTNTPCVGLILTNTFPNCGGFIVSPP